MVKEHPLALHSLATLLLCFAQLLQLICTCICCGFCLPFSPNSQTVSPGEATGPYSSPDPSGLGLGLQVSTVIHCQWLHMHVIVRTALVGRQGH